LSQAARQAWTFIDAIITSPSFLPLVAAVTLSAASSQKWRASSPDWHHPKVVDDEAPLLDYAFGLLRLVARSSCTHSDSTLWLL
jgi:hypothetical protein